MSALTFDMRGPQKAQPFVGPLDGRVRRRCVSRHYSVLYRADANRTEGRHCFIHFFDSLPVLTSAHGDEGPGPSVTLTNI